MTRRGSACGSPTEFPRSTILEAAAANAYHTLLISINCQLAAAHLTFTYNTQHLGQGTSRQSNVYGTFQESRRYTGRTTPSESNILIKRTHGFNSLFQDPPPPQNDSGGVPKIGGSSAGFIALVVSLAAIFLICCIGIFILLRGHKLDPFERHARRVLAGRREDTVYQVPLGPPGIRQKFGRVFGFWKRRREGWQRASSGDDEWDASYQPAGMHDQPRELNDSDMRWISGAAPSISRSETSDSVQLSVPDHGAGTPPSASATPTPADAAMQHTPYTDPFVTSPTSMKFGERFANSPPMESEKDDKRFSVQSGRSADGTPNIRSMRKFDNGTKFKESLEF